MKILKRYLSIILIIIIISIIFSGCVEKKEDINTINQNNRYLMYDIGSLPEDLSKTDMDVLRVRDIERVLFQGLVYEKENSKDGIGYALAKSCDISKDGLVYTFALKDNIKWNDGSPITAQDFVDFFKDILSQDYDSVYRYELKCIYGVSDFIDHNKDFSAVAITAPKDNILQIRLNYPSPHFLQLLTQPMYGLRKIDSNIINWKKNYKYIKYSGAFFIKNIEGNGNILLNKNKNYVFKSDVKSNQIVLTTNKNGSAYSLADFETYNNLDIFLNPPSTEVDRLKSKGEAAIFPKLSVKGLFFNFNSNTAVSNYNFRKAVQLSMDRNELIDNVVGDYGEALTSYLPREMNSSPIDNSKVDNYNKSEALKYFKESNYNKNNVIRFVYVDNDTNKKVCENIIKMINYTISNEGSNSDTGAIGNVKFQLKGYSLKDINEVIKNNNYDMYLGDYNINYNNIMSFLEIWKSNSPYNIYGFKDIAYDDLIYTGNVAEDLNKKYEVYNKCIEELKNRIPVIPLYSKNTIACSKTSVQSLNLNEFGNVLIEKLQEK
ncbi:ABC-type oligopeptide transport system, periplasmic component [Clostridium pasteurianum DSM 525 = ATCC 6013]|uniref:ABC-type oligopeptide transport system, periplasmic component n=1 Tax=Clostridium pasteurianum DSM 525 = ATCC 6013 TaxID=1262449 RepID=A0A0H3J0S1_CLOPA|nr:peptide ABC transporter substrate-binding protein [Clostridium pasteurianum]AJA47441.1 ABC-type oligopeptide transport system, periplasmic component [Clostridium pasteurianum DSM 525 = ATCC 6013]AJA51429.1 ABC-type oligopeptide transport system, periplasmic component [Clostridium pasteurianum DSM 525 = ATCC 6013]AOZ74767.1 peptide ABC transporter substrate-binding protein [Clostridium pasteurianum DSM 525 = ATCC 6013]AOZ78563.1 peptide ABC transporter substrate-binding protein [Clostridium p